MVASKITFLLCIALYMSVAECRFIEGSEDSRSGILSFCKPFLRKSNLLCFICKGFDPSCFGYTPIPTPSTSTSSSTSSSTSTTTTTPKPTTNANSTTTIKPTATTTTNITTTTTKPNVTTPGAPRTTLEEDEEV